ncbi:MAG: sensor domain-containing diguanylate cyclase [Bacteroidota bacterium]
MKTLGLLTAEVKGLLSVLFQRYSLIDAAVGLVGLVMLALSLFVSVVSVKIISFVLFIIALGFLYASLRGKQMGTLARPDLPYERNEREEQPMAKKIVFDDLHSSPIIRYEEEATAEQVGSSPHAELAVNPAPRKREPIDFDIKDFFDLDAEAFKSESEPRAEFDFLLSKVLSVAKEVLFAHTVALFWANRDKHQMVLEAVVTDSESFMAGRRFAIEGDVVSRIALNGKPEILTQVNPISEKEMLRYYDQVDFVKSFIGAPVFFNQNVVAVLAADSRVEDAYGAETLSLVGQFTKLISALLKTYTGKYDLLVDSEILSAIRRMEELLHKDLSLWSVVESLATEASRLVNWDFLTVILYDEEQRGWLVRKVMNRTEEHYLRGDETIDFTKSIVGSAIKGNASRYIEEMSTMSDARFYQGENISTRGSFIVLPISSMRKCYGAFTVESRQPRNYSLRDAEVLNRILSVGAAAIEVLCLQDVVREYVIIDEVTDLYTKKYLLQRINEEVQRADDLGTDLSLVMFSIDSKDDLVNRYGNEGFDFVFYAVGKMVQRSIRAYDVLGRFDTQRFGVLLVNTAANDAYLWAEKIRKTIASTILTFQDKSFSVTVSVGVCGAVEGTTTDDLVANTLHVLNKGTESGGNLVRVF